MNRGFFRLADGYESDIDRDSTDAAHAAQTTARFHVSQNHKVCWDCGESWAKHNLSTALGGDFGHLVRTVTRDGVDASSTNALSKAQAFRSLEHQDLTKYQIHGHFTARDWGQCASTLTTTTTLPCLAECVHNECSFYSSYVAGDCSVDCAGCAPYVTTCNPQAGA